MSFNTQRSLTTRKLTHALDSLVRVSRRVEICPFTSFNGLHTIIGSTPQMEVDTFPKKPLHLMCLSNNRAFTHSTSKLPCFDTHAPTHKGTSTPRQQHNPCITPCTSLHVANQSSSMQRQQSIISTQTSFASSSAISSTFNPRFKVLFMFPSWYLFAIGFTIIISLG